MLIPRDGEALLSKTSARAGDLPHSNSLFARVFSNCGQGFFSPPPVLAHLKLQCPLCQGQLWVSCHFTAWEVTDPNSPPDPRGVNSSERNSALRLDSLSPVGHSGAREGAVRTLLSLFCVTTDEQQGKEELQQGWEKGEIFQFHLFRAVNGSNDVPAWLGTWDWAFHSSPHHHLDRTPAFLQIRSQFLIWKIQIWCIQNPLLSLEYLSHFDCKSPHYSHAPRLPIQWIHFQ